MLSTETVLRVGEISGSNCGEAMKRRKHGGRRGSVAGPAFHRLVLRLSAERRRSCGIEVDVRPARSHDKWKQKRPETVMGRHAEATVLVPAPDFARAAVFLYVKTDGNCTEGKLPDARSAPPTSGSGTEILPAGQPRVIVFSDCGSPASRGATLQRIRRCDSCRLCFRFIAQSSQSTGGNLEAVFKDSKNECPLNLHCTCCAAVDYCL
jgi:hypothetical protein